MPPDIINLAEMDTRMDAGLDTCPGYPVGNPARPAGGEAAHNPAQRRCHPHESGVRGQRLYPDHRER